MARGKDYSLRTNEELLGDIEMVSESAIREEMARRFQYYVRHGRLPKYDTINETKEECEYAD